MIPFISQRNISIRGFTLIELMVSIGIFGIVATISVGTLLVMIDANRKAQASSAAMTNMSFVMDSITRNIRTGYNYRCVNIAGSVTSSFPSSPVTGDCVISDGYNSILYTDGRTGDRVGYRLYNNAIQRKVDSGNWLNITADSVYIDTFQLIVTHTDKFYDSGSTDTDQPRVVLLVSGKANRGKESETSFNLQTNITQRVLDY